MAMVVVREKLEDVSQNLIRLDQDYLICSSAFGGPSTALKSTTTFVLAIYAATIHLNQKSRELYLGNPQASLTALGQGGAFSPPYAAFCARSAFMDFSTETEATDLQQASWRYLLPFSWDPPR